MSSSSGSTVYFASSNSSSILTRGPAPRLFDSAASSAVIFVLRLRLATVTLALGQRPELRSQDSHRGFTG